MPIEPARNGFRAGQESSSSWPGIDPSQPGMAFERARNRFWAGRDSFSSDPGIGLERARDSSSSEPGIVFERPRHGFRPGIFLSTWCGTPRKGSHIIGEAGWGWGCSINVSVTTHSHRNQTLTSVDISLQSSRGVRGAPPSFFSSEHGTAAECSRAFFFPISTLLEKKQTKSVVWRWLSLEQSS